jgi:hypothetical protein
MLQLTLSIPLVKLETDNDTSGVAQCGICRSNTSVWVASDSFLLPVTETNLKTKLSTLLWTLNETPAVVCAECLNFVVTIDCLESQTQKRIDRLVNIAENAHFAVTQSPLLRRKEVSKPGAAVLQLDYKDGCLKSTSPSKRPACNDQDSNDMFEMSNDEADSEDEVNIRTAKHSSGQLKRRSTEPLEACRVTGKRKVEI